MPEVINLLAVQERRSPLGKCPVVYFAARNMTVLHIDLAPEVKMKERREGAGRT